MEWPLPSLLPYLPTHFIQRQNDPKRENVCRTATGKERLWEVNTIESGRIYVLNILSGCHDHELVHKRPCLMMFNLYALVLDVCQGKPPDCSN